MKNIAIATLRQVVVVTRDEVVILDKTLAIYKNCIGKTEHK